MKGGWDVSAWQIGHLRAVVWCCWVITWSSASSFNTVPISLSFLVASSSSSPHAEPILPRSLLPGVVLVAVLLYTVCWMFEWWSDGMNGGAVSCSHNQGYVTRQQVDTSMYMGGTSHQDRIHTWKNRTWQTEECKKKNGIDVWCNETMDI